jgi:nucleoside-diphosphate-sugar epimerase
VTKAEAEIAAERLAREGGVELVIVRPTIVYGPGSGRILNELSRVKFERIKMLDAGRGYLNMIYVDDLVDGIILALDSPAAAGESFLMSGDPAVSWHEYLTCLAMMCRKPVPPAIPVWRARLEATAARWHFRFTRHPRRIEDTDFALMHQPSTVSVEKARRLLGFRPQITLHEGMRRTEAWLRETGWLPAASRAA